MCALLDSETSLSPPASAGNGTTGVLRPLDDTDGGASVTVPSSGGSVSVELDLSSDGSSYLVATV